MTVKYHFFGKECLINRELSDYSNFEESLKKLSFNYRQQPLFLKQIHSNEVIVIDDENKLYLQDKKPKADALVTNLKNIALCVISADCVPVLFYDKEAQIIAIAHAGWKGAKSNIISQTVSNMLKIGAKTDNIHCIIGPCIKQKSYEVSNEFYQDFINDKADNNKFFIDSKNDNHFMFDLTLYVKEKIQNEGIKKILDQEIDTYSNSETLFSYRRSCHLKQKDCGRNISIIMID